MFFVFFRYSLIFFRRPIIFFRRPIIFFRRFFSGFLPELSWSSPWSTPSVFFRRPVVFFRRYFPGLGWARPSSEAGLAGPGWPRLGQCLDEPSLSQVDGAVPTMPASATTGAPPLDELAEIRAKPLAPQHRTSSHIFEKSCPVVVNWPLIFWLGPELTHLDVAPHLIPWHSGCRPLAVSVPAFGFTCLRAEDPRSMNILLQGLHVVVSKAPSVAITLCATFSTFAVASRAL